MTSYHIKYIQNSNGLNYEICDSFDTSLFFVEIVGRRNNSNVVLMDIDSNNVVLSFNGYTDGRLRFTYSVKNEDDIEIMKISKDQFTLCLNISGLFGDLRVRRIKSDIREFDITKDGALIGKLLEPENKKSKHMNLVVYDEFFTLVLIGILIIVDIQKYYGNY